MLEEGRRKKSVGRYGGRRRGGRERSVERCRVGKVMLTARRKGRGKGNGCRQDERRRKGGEVLYTMEWKLGKVVVSCICM